MKTSGVRGFVLFLLSSLAATAACGGEVDASAVDPAPPVDDGSLSPQWQKDIAPPTLGMHETKEAHDLHGFGGGGGSRALMVNHGGPIMTTFVTQAIFWGPSWSTAAFAGDKMTGLDTFYSGYSGSNYANASNEYVGSNGHVGGLGTYLGHAIDTSTATGGSSTLAILTEVCKVISDPTITPPLTPPKADGTSYYPVYTDVPRGRANYCAWHSAGRCTRTGPVLQFGFFFALDGDPGCDPQDGSGLHSQGLAALANVSAHELSEARTDPQGSGWFDSSGQENGDKCAWTFGAPLVKLGDTSWMLQGEWSNNAYTAGTGYPNSAGQKGCLSGL
jgi:hypothetical protein